MVIWETNFAWYSVIIRSDDYNRVQYFDMYFETKKNIQYIILTLSYFDNIELLTDMFVT